MKEPTMIDHVKAAGDGVSIVASIGALAGWVTPLAALASLIWTCIRIYETRTVQGWLEKIGAKKPKPEAIAPSKEHSDD